MIPEPHRTYVLELLDGLGDVSADFILAGAQAIKFVLPAARATKDFDFVLDAVSLRSSDARIIEKLEVLNYRVVESARNFQFQKAIPNSPEVMRIEFMAPDQHKRRSDIRVDIQDGLHARACAGGNIVISESDFHRLEGRLPNGAPATAQIRVTRPSALVMMKCLAVADRYGNIRGQQEYEHDREVARTHSADLIAIVSAQSDLGDFRARFVSQFRHEPELKDLVMKAMGELFGNDTSPGILLYEELLRSPASELARAAIDAELSRATSLLRAFLAQEDPKKG